MPHNLFKYVILFWVLFALGFYQSAKAQQRQLFFTQINDEQGLSNSSVGTIFQDKRGFIWFGTIDGLNRFDGSHIKVYKNDLKNPHSLSDNHIRCIFEDSNNRLWIGTASGLDLFDPKSDQFVHYRHHLPYTEINGDRINGIFQDQESHLWLCTGWGALSEFNIGSGKFTDYFYDQNQKPTNNHNLYSIDTPKAGEAWIATDSGLKIFDLVKKQFISVKAPFVLKVPLRAIRATSIGERAVWIGTEGNGLYRADIALGKVVHFVHDDRNIGSIGSDRINTLFIDKKDQVFIGTTNSGLNVFEPITKTFRKYSNDPGVKGSLSQRSVSSIFEDNQQNLWVGTPRGGVNLAFMVKEKFELFRNEADPHSLSYNDVKAFAEDHAGNLWVGTDGGGLNCYNRSTGIFTRYRFDARNNRSIASDQVMSICVDHKGRLWVGTFDGGLNLFDSKNRNFRRYIHDPKDSTSIASNLVEYILEDRKNRMWVCTYNGGLDLFDPEKGTFRKMGKSNLPDMKLLATKLISVKEDRQGELWIVSADDGINRFNPASGRIRHYFRGSNHPDLSVVFIDMQGRVWAGKKGLYLYDPSKDDFFPCPPNKVFNDTYVKDIVEGQSGELWISTTNGLRQYDTRTSNITIYNTHDGLQGPEFEFNASLKTKDGKIYFGGTNGFNAFTPDSIIRNQYLPPVYFTGLQVFDKFIGPDQGKVIKQDISYARTVVLNYHQTSVSFDFAALNFLKSENNSYSYRLENFDPDWKYAGHTGHAAYTNLDPGKYIFRVKAANNDGLWNPQEATLDIIITPPFWKTWWFILLLFLIISSALFWVYEFKRKLDIKTLLELQKEENHKQQLQFFTNISHEFRTPLSLIVGPLEAIRQAEPSLYRNSYLQIIEKNALRLVRLVNELMDFRKVQSEVMKLNVKPFKDMKLFEEIAEEFKAIAEQKAITFSCNFEEPGKQLWLDAQVVEKIINNLLNNALKYTGRGGCVDFNISFDLGEYQKKFKNELVFKNKTRSEAYVFIVVRDNGIGISAESISHLFEQYYRISAAHLGSGLGLAFVKGLTELHHGDIFVSSENQLGSEFIIALPYLKQDYKPEDLREENFALAPVQLESLQQNSLAGESQSPTSEVIPVPVVSNEEYILLVDDNSDVRSFLKETLKTYYRIAEANDGEEGIAMAMSVYPDLIISDVMMPKMDGNEFCARIKNHIETSHVPFIMLTAKDALEAKIEGAQSGADIYLTKPFSIQLLLATVANIFEQRRKVRAHYLNDYYSDAKELVHNQKDKDFVEKLFSIIDKQLINPDLDVEYLSQEMGMSQSKLYQKIKKISGQSIVEFIRSYRLKKAVQIMTHEDLSINEVIFRVGIQTPSYFTKSFKKEFGKTPTQFLNEIKHNLG